MNNLNTNTMKNVIANIINLWIILIEGMNITRIYPFSCPQTKQISFIDIFMVFENKVPKIARIKFCIIILNIF